MLERADRLELWVDGKLKAVLITRNEDVQKHTRQDWLNRYLIEADGFEIREYHGDEGKPDRRDIDASRGHYVG